MPTHLFSTIPHRAGSKFLPVVSQLIVLNHICCLTRRLGRCISWEDIPIWTGCLLERNSSHGVSMTYGNYASMSQVGILKWAILRMMPRPLRQVLGRDVSRTALSVNGENVEVRTMVWK